MDDRNSSTRRDAEPHSEIVVRFVSDSRLLCAIRGLVRGYFTSLGLAPDQIDSVVLAVDEACANSIRHAYQHKPDGRVELTFRLGGRFVEVDIRDFGKPARWSERDEKPQEEIRRNALPSGGFGVKFMRDIFDEVEFSSGKRRGNCVRLRLKRPRVPRRCRDRSGTKTEGSL